MELNTGKYTITEIDGVLCSVAASDVNRERMEFLKELLGINGYTVKVTEKKEGESVSFTVAVTDVLFNPVLDVYKRRLKTKTGHMVTPAYWLQKTTNETEDQVNYWK